jgi:hypothetical protein
MIGTAEASKQATSSIPNQKDKPHFKVIENTYQNNTHSDYTETITSLMKGFDYDSNSHHYWGDPELSIFYGTPLYEQASPTQRLALNHLFWVAQYTHTANAEANTMLYNQVTSGVFARLPGYETLCQELDFETSQERHHIKAFQKIGYKTKLALLGKESLTTSLNPASNKTAPGGVTKRSPTLPAPQSLQSLFPSDWADQALNIVQDSTFRAITRLFQKDKAQYYSKFLQAQNRDSIPTTDGGLAGATGSPTVFKFMTLNWGSSPFMAAQYYSTRMVANMSLKAYEHRYFKYFKDLEKKGGFMPVPTAISHFHLLDEAFHTTMSQLISQEVHQDFHAPTGYERLLSNIIIYRLQKGLLGGLSGGLPVVFRDDTPFMTFFYRLLQSPLFGLSAQEALDWMERCLCHEHEGYHVNLKFHQSLLSAFQRYFDRLTYLWPVNRELRLMVAGGSIEQAIQKNGKAFRQFARSFA